MNVLGIAGSLRSGSFNRALLRAAQEVAPHGMSIEIYDLAGIPLYDADLEAQGDPEPVQRFKAAIAQADGLLISTPEYQHSIPGVLKNAFDWASRPHASSVLAQKPVAIMGVTSGMSGTARAQMQLREVLCYNDMRAVSRPEVLIAYAQTKFDAKGNFIDENGRTFVRQLLENLMR